MNNSQSAQSFHAIIEKLVKRLQFGVYFYIFIMYNKGISQKETIHET